MNKFGFKPICNGFVLLVALFFLSLNIQGQNAFRKALDFDGDGRADYAVTRNEGGAKVWYIWQSSGGFKGAIWGLASDRNVASDYDGDGKADIAVFRSPTNFPPFDYTFWVISSQSGNLLYKEFTNLFSITREPMHQDYNGDGKADAAVWILTGHVELPPVSSSVYVSYMGNTGINETLSIPAREKPFRIGDLDGNGSADNARYLQNNNNVVTLGDGRILAFGLAGDQYLTADFDGDGKGELAIWRNSDGYWWWLRSSDGILQSYKWGMTGDTPVPADYDGDGRTDLAVWRNGVYWISGSQTGVKIFGWGLPTDQPVQN